MGHPALKFDIHPDQTLLDDCQQWHIDIKEYFRLIETSDDAGADAFYAAKIMPIKNRIIATRANSSEGRVAKASVFKADYGKELADTDEYLEQFAASLCDDMIAEVAAASADQALFDLCRRCVEMLAANDAIYEAVPRDVDISDEVSDAASAHYDTYVAPLLNEIEKTPAVTLAGFVAKARVFMHDGITEITGEEHISSACAVMLNDLSGLDLVPEVPEAPHHYQVVRSSPTPAATKEAA